MYGIGRRELGLSITRPVGSFQKELEALLTSNSIDDFSIFRASGHNEIRFTSSKIGWYYPNCIYKPDGLPEEYFKKAIRIISADLIKNIKRILLKSSFYTPIQPTNYYPTGFFNAEIWDTIPVSSCFMVIDIDKFWWHTAYKLGFISKNIFDSFYKEDNYKDVCNISLGRLSRNLSKEYFKNGKYNYSITCNYFTDFYNDIRNYSYNLIDSIANKYRSKIIGKQHDSIYFPKDNNLMCDLIDEINNAGYDCKVDAVIKKENGFYVKFVAISPSGNLVTGNPIIVRLFNEKNK